MALSQSDLQGELLSLLPTGPAWNYIRASGANSNFAQLLLPLAGSLSQLEVDAEAILDEVDPLTCVQLLDQWEELLGLPDPCAGTGATVALRQAQARARLTDRGGTSRPAMIAYAEQLGFSLNIVEFREANVAVSSIGDQIFDLSWAYAWMLQNVVDLTTQDGSLTAERTSVLLCEFDRLRPMETTVLWGDLPGTTEDVSSDVENMVAGS